MTEPLTATACLAAIRRGSLSAEDVLDACLERIVAREPVVKAFATLDIDGARAHRIDQHPVSARGPLAGIPLGFKDISDTAGLASQYNSQRRVKRRRASRRPAVPFSTRCGRCCMSPASPFLAIPAPTACRSASSSSAGAAPTAACWLLPPGSKGPSDDDHLVPRPRLTVADGHVATIDHAAQSADAAVVSKAITRYGVGFLGEFLRLSSSNDENQAADDV